MLSPKRNFAMQEASQVRDELDQMIRRHGLKQCFIAEKASVNERALSNFLRKRSDTLNKAAMARLKELVHSIREQERLVLLSNPNADLVLLGPLDETQTQQESSRPEANPRLSSASAPPPLPDTTKSASLSPREKLIDTVWRVMPDRLKPTLELWLLDLSVEDLQELEIEYRATGHRKA